jgi:hypothetical protein
MIRIYLLILRYHGTKLIRRVPTIQLQANVHTMLGVMYGLASTHAPLEVRNESLLLRCIEDASDNVEVGKRSKKLPVHCMMKAIKIF